MEYKDSLLVNEYREWWEDGKEKVKGQYKNSEKDGQWIYYDPGRRGRYEFYDSDSLISFYDFEYYENGQLKEEPSFDNGIVDGQWIEYYGPEYKKGSSIIKCMGEFELFNNYYHSDHDRHFPSWTVYQKNCIGFYGSKKKGSLKNGVWKYFSPDHVLASEMIWKKGIKWEGTITSFHPNGRQWKEEIFETKKKKLILKNILLYILILIYTNQPLK